MLIFLGITISCKTHNQLTFFKMLETSYRNFYNQNIFYGLPFRTFVTCGKFASWRKEVKEMQVKEFNCQINKQASIQFMQADHSPECSQPPKVMRSLIIEKLDEKLQSKASSTLSTSESSVATRSVTWLEKRCLVRSMDCEARDLV